MPFFHRQGKLPRKKHITFYKEDGKSLYREELVSTRGFDGVYSTKYHIHEPTRVVAVDEVPLKPQSEWTEAALEYWHMDTEREKLEGNYFSSRDIYMKNDTMAIGVAHVSEQTDSFFRNAYAHECLFVHYGEGLFESDYGALRFGPGDHLVIPKGVTYRMHFDSLDRVKLLVIESRDPYQIPRRYCNEQGQILEHAPYCERDFRLPVLGDPVDEFGAFSLQIKAGDRQFRYTLDHHPFDVVGWDGYCYPYAFNIKDFCPIVGKIHQPPPVHQLFYAGTFVVCNFVPRLFDFHPDAIPAPYFHTNVDSCEVLYYVEGDFMSRKGVKEGSFTLHPTGIPHGPQPGKTEASIGKEKTDEYAVMIDSFAPLRVTTAVRETAVPGYSQSWLN